MVNRGHNYSGNMGTDKHSVQSLWREAMVMRELARDGVTESRERRAQAETARRAAEQEALKATEEFCQGLRAQAEADLERASNTLAETDRLKKEFEANLEERGLQAEADIQSRQDKVDAELARAAVIRKEASEYELARRKEADTIVAEALGLAEQNAGEARNHAESLIAAAQVDADDIRDEMRAQTAGEIRSLVADVEAAQSAVLEELETQRILTEAARIKATSPEAAARAADIGAGRQPIGLEDSALLERVRSFQEQTAEAQPDAEPELILIESEEPAKARKTSRKRSMSRARKKKAA